MENFIDQCLELSDRIVKEICSLMIANGELIHDFKHIFSYCGQYEEEASLFGVHSLERRGEDNFFFATEPGDPQVHHSANNMTAESLARLLQNLKDEYYDAKVEKLRKLLKEKGEEICFNEDTDFLFKDETKGTDLTHQSLNYIQLDEDNFTFCTSWVEDKSFFNWCGLEQTPYETLDKIIAYIEEKQRKIDILMTDEQLKVMDEFYNAVKKMQDAGIAVVRDAAVEGGFYFVNGHCIRYCGGLDADESDGYVRVQDQIDQAEVFSYTDFSDFLFDSDAEDLWAKRTD